MPNNPSRPQNSEESTPPPDVTLGKHSAVETTREMYERHASTGSEEPAREHVMGQLAAAVEGLSILYSPEQALAFLHRAQQELEDLENKRGK